MYSVLPPILIRKFNAFKWREDVLGHSLGTPNTISKIAKVFNMLLLPKMVILQPRLRGRQLIVHHP